MAARHATETNAHSTLIGGLPDRWDRDIARDRTSSDDSRAIYRYGLIFFAPTIALASAADLPAQ